jgi:hypothetical protein
MESDGRELATVSHRADDTPARSHGGENGTSPSPLHNWFRQRMEEVEGTLAERWTGFE